MYIRMYVCTCDMHLRRWHDTRRAAAATISCSASKIDETRCYAGPRQWSTDEVCPLPFVGHYCRRHVSKLKRVPSDFSDERSFVPERARRTQFLSAGKIFDRPDTSRTSIDLRNACVSVFFISYIPRPPPPPPSSSSSSSPVRIYARARV